jgi:hypothetical protein
MTTNLVAENKNVLQFCWTETDPGSIELRQRALFISGDSEGGSVSLFIQVIGRFGFLEFGGLMYWLSTKDCSQLLTLLGLMSPFHHLQSQQWRSSPSCASSLSSVFGLIADTAGKDSPLLRWIVIRLSQVDNPECSPLNIHHLIMSTKSLCDVRKHLHILQGLEPGHLWGAYIYANYMPICLGLNYLGNWILIHILVGRIFYSNIRDLFNIHSSLFNY